MSLSRRPAGNRPILRYSSGSRSRTVSSLPSSVAESTPAGLFIMIQRAAFHSTVSPDTVMTSLSGSAFSAGERAGTPLTSTSPLRTRSETCRRE